MLLLVGPLHWNRPWLFRPTELHGFSHQFQDSNVSLLPSLQWDSSNGGSQVTMVNFMTRWFGGSPMKSRNLHIPGIWMTFSWSQGGRQKWKFWKGEFRQEETSFVAPEWGAQPLELEFYRASQVISGPWGPQPPTASAQRPERLTPGGELKIWEDKPPSAQGDISGVALLGETEVASCGCYRWSRWDINIVVNPMPWTICSRGFTIGYTTISDVKCPQMVGSWNYPALNIDRTAISWRD